MTASTDCGPDSPPPIDLMDPSLFAENRAEEVFGWLRDHAPIYWHDAPGGQGFWVITRHRDIVAVYSDADTFASRYGMRLASDATAVAEVSQRMLIVSDPPAHTRLRRALVQAFTPPAVRAMQERVRVVVREVLDEALDHDQVDFVGQVARIIPNRVICELMGFPRADWDWIGHLTTDAIDSADESERRSAHAEIFLYIAELLEERRARPAADLISVIAATPVDEAAIGSKRTMSDDEVVFNCNGILAGANETTRYSAAGAVLAFASWPRQWATVRASAEAVPGAVEEVLRWTTPGVHALRTVTSATRLCGLALSPGDLVTVWNSSGNRDERVFRDPGQFDVTRRPNPHLAFGNGRHLCLGSRLARMELSVLLEETRLRVESFELTGAPEWTPSNFTWGLRRLPVSLIRSRGH